MTRSSSTWIAADLATAHPPLVRLAELMDTREHLAVLPTPLHHAPRLSAALDREVWLKRDDLTGTGLGGNKIRKMELLAARARAENADTLVTVGAPQSNHARTVATVAAMLGLDCHLVLGGRAPATPSGNLLLSTLVGAQLHWAGTADWQALARAAEQVVTEQERRGRRVYSIPVGGSVPHGVAAFVAAYLELVVQLARVGLAASAVYCASSSGGTQAGLHLGWALASRILADELPAGATPPVTGVDVARISDPLAEEVERLVDATAELLGVSQIWKEVQESLRATGGAGAQVLDGYLGAGYAQPTAGSDAALHLIARTEGVIVDPVYSAKALHAVCEAQGGGPLVFWHTGGVPAVFAEH